MKHINEIGKYERVKHIDEIQILYERFYTTDKCEENEITFTKGSFTKYDNIIHHVIIHPRNTDSL